MNKYAFFDRDGTLIYEPPDTRQIDSLKKLRILDGVIVGLRALRQAGYELVLVTNQNGLGTAAFPYPAFDAPQRRMLELFAAHDITFAEIFVCPHLPENNCGCRKPKIGLVGHWLTTVLMDKSRSFMYGDRDTDGQFAKNLGIQFIHTKTNTAMNIQLFTEYLSL